MDTKDYVVTDLAGPKVAGRVAGIGETLTLTEPEARTELLAGAIVEKGRQAKSAAKPSAAALKRLAAIRARAAGEGGAPSEPALAAPAADAPPADA